MKKLYIYIIPILFLLLSHTASIIADIPPPPNPPRLVNDFAKLLTTQEEEQLELKLREFNHKTSNQIVVITVSSLDGYNPATYAHKVGEMWQVGQKGFNNGIVVLVKPKLSYKEKGHTYLAIGYGLEAAIPDAVAKQIVENKMIPEFKNESYYNGIRRATNSLMALASKEISAYGYNGKKSNKYTSILMFFLPFVGLLAYLLIQIWGKHEYISMSSSGSDYSSFSGWSSSGNTSSNFSSGFSGFGGGSFGGGGAGGSW